MCIALFVVIVAGMFAFAYMKKQELNTATLKTEDTAVPKVAYADLTRITAKHFFIDGVHTFVGEIPFPTPCDLLESSATIAESFPEQITLDFTVVNNSELCAQVETLQRFKVEAQASDKATVQARFMGRPVELNLVPPAEGETPDDFELFIKG
jgi:hypothetical protein